MKKIYFSLIIVAGILSFTSCSNSNEAEDSTSANESACFYSYNEASTTLEWTAYKTNDKVPVAGTFNEISVEAEKAENQLDVIRSISFKIKTSSVETNNEERNGKIAEHFFNVINTPEIIGKVVSVNDKGETTVMLTMNGISIDVKGTSKLEGETFSFESTIDMLSWNGMAGINKLNEVCKDLHTGPDGKSKLWSEIALKFSTTLSSDCN